MKYLFFTSMLCVFLHPVHAQPVNNKFYALTISELRALRAPVKTCNYYTSDEGKEGFWRYDPDDLKTADNTGTIIVSTNGKRFKRIIENSVNVKWFDAKGNGVTDDTKAFQAAMDFADSYDHLVKTGISRNLYNVYVPASKGSYKITHLSLKNVSIVGESSRQSIIEALPSSYSGFLKLAASPINSVEYKNFSIRGTSLNTRQNGFDFTAIPQSFPGFTGGLWFSKFENIAISNFSNHGLHFYCKDGVGDMANQVLTFINVHVFPPNNSVTTRALYVEGQAGQLQFINCMFQGGGNKLPNSASVELKSLLTSNDQAGGAIKFTGCTFESIDKGVVTFNTMGVSFDGCWFESLKGAITAKSTSKLSITTCTFANAANNSGKGYLVDNQNSFISFKDNNIIGTVDQVGISSSNYVNGWNFGGNSSSNSDFKFSTNYVTKQVTVADDGKIYCDFNKTILCNASSIVIRDILSGLEAQESIFVKAWTGPITFQTGGNITLGNQTCITLQHGQVAQFVKYDLSSEWTLVGAGFSACGAPITQASKSDTIRVITNNSGTSSELKVVPENNPLDAPRSLKGFGDRTLNIYPNPTMGKLTINTHEGIISESDIRVLDVQGIVSTIKPVKRISDTVLEMDLSPLIHGLYMIEVKMGQAYKTTGIIKL